MDLNLDLLVLDLDLDLAFSDSDSEFDLPFSLDGDLFLWYFCLGVNLPFEEPPCLLRGILDLDLDSLLIEQHQSFGRVCSSAVFWPQIVRIETSKSV